MIEIALSPTHLHGRKVDYVMMADLAAEQGGGEQKMLLLDNGAKIAEGDCKTAHVPPCCHALESAELAERMYATYNLGGPIERAGLTWDDKQVPTWAKLVERTIAGDMGAAGVLAKWRAVAIFTLTLGSPANIAQVTM